MVNVTSSTRSSGSLTDVLLLSLIMLAMNVWLPQAAWAQNPFTGATNAAGKLDDQLRTFALAMGGVGMTICLLLGFFNKLNWQWVATGVAVSFALAVTPSGFSWIQDLGGDPSAGYFAAGGAGVTGEDPFIVAASAATTLTSQLAAFGSVLGAIGVSACLMLGFFGKLNWRWLTTGIGVSFAITLVSGTIKWLSALA